MLKRTWRSGCLGKTALIIVALLILFTGCAILGALLPEAPATPTPTVVAENVDTPAPEANPTDTPMPEPTATPKPTDTPAPTATPTPADPVVRIRVAIDKALGDGNRDLPRVIDVRFETLEDGNNYLTVEWNIDESLTEGLTKRGAMLDAVAILQAVAENDAGLEYKELDAIGYYEMVDKFGNAKNMMVMDLVYNYETIHKINFENFITDNVYAIMDDGFVHPAFQP